MKPQEMYDLFEVVISTLEEAKKRDGLHDIGINTCPVCSKLFIHRRNKRCTRCHTALYYQGEYMPDRKGYMWANAEGRWITVESLYSQDDR